MQGRGSKGGQYGAVKLLMLWAGGLDRSMDGNAKPGSNARNLTRARMGTTQSKKAGNWWHFRGVLLLTIVLKPDSPGKPKKTSRDRDKHFGAG